MKVPNHGPGTKVSARKDLKLKGHGFKSHQTPNAF